MENQIVSFVAGQNKIELSPEIVKSVLVAGDQDAVTDQEITMFIALCQYRHLNPFLKQAYLVKFKNSPAQIIVSQDVFIERAVGNQNCAGWKEGIIVIDKNGEEVSRESSIVRPDDELIGGWCEVYRHDWSQPLKTEVSLKEYKKFKNDGQPMALWKTHEASQIVKVARSQGLRRAFPEDLQGCYDELEGASITGMIDVTPPKEHVKQPQRKTQTAETEQPKAEQSGTEIIIPCPKCGKSLAKTEADAAAVIDWCNKKFGGDVMCRECQKLASTK